jgi:SAM-dependent methyltransferase
MRLSLLTCSLVAAMGLAAAQQIGTVHKDVPYVPTTPQLVEQMLKLAGVTKNDVVYDLGCGDGRLVITAVKDFGARGVGIDIDPERIKDSTENAKKDGVTKRIAFRNEDLFEADIHEATVVTLYLWPWINLKLKDKLLKDLKPGTRVVSNLHDMGEWKPDKQIKVDGHPIYLWIIPAKAK